VQTKQFSVKVFEAVITDEDEFISFFEKNYIFFKEHLISISGLVTKNIIQYLNDKELKFIVDFNLPKGKAQKKVSNSLEEIKQDKKSQETKEKSNPQAVQQAEQKVHDNLRVIDTLVRSGQELKISGDLLLLNRVNSGGTIDINGNLIITQIVEGSIRCRGNFMMLKASPKANIVFHDVEVDNEYLQERLNRVELKNNEIRITPVLKETSWV